MVAQLRKWLRFLALLGGVLSTTTSCSLFDDRIELVTINEWRFYSIAPESILDSLDQGYTDVFTLMVTTPEAASEESKTSVSWSQSDYFRIATTLHERSWGEPLGDNNLWRMSFYLNCKDIDRGTFNEANFGSYQIINTGQEETRIEYIIRIRPSENSAVTLEQGFRPNTHILTPIDLEQYRITAEQALRIAEERGGDRARLDANNACQIDALAPGPDGKGWRIIYQDFPSFTSLLFEIAIDPQTGEYNVLYTK